RRAARAAAPQHRWRRGSPRSRSDSPPRPAPASARPAAWWIVRERQPQGRRPRGARPARLLISSSALRLLLRFPPPWHLGGKSLRAFGHGGQPSGLNIAARAEVLQKVLRKLRPVDPVPPPVGPAPVHVSESVFARELPGAEELSGPGDHARIGGERGNRAADVQRCF